MQRAGAALFVVAQDLQFERQVDLANRDAARNRQHDRSEVENASDAGTNQTWMVGATDMGGVNARIAKRVVDMGPYELFTQGLVILLR